MESEALTNIRTMRQVKTSLDVARQRRARTTNGLFKTPVERDPGQVPLDGRTMQVLEKEKARFAAYENSVMKSRERLLKSRKKLATIISRNRALTDLRHDLQKARWYAETSRPPVTAAPADQPSPGGLIQMELEY